MITGVFSNWDGIDRTTNPGGGWLPVTIEESGGVRLQRANLSTVALNDSRATLLWEAVVDAAATVAVDLRWSLVPLTFDGAPATFSEHRIISGDTHLLSGNWELPEPRLWWTHDLGCPDLYKATLDVVVDGIVSDRQTFRSGVRTFELRDMIPHLNGVRFLVKGNNYPPGDTRIARVTPEAALQDVRLAIGCHMNLLRLHAHIAHPALYDAADELGVLLWQDFPLQWLYRKSILPEARRQVRHMVKLLGNHPAIVCWCMHNEPVFITDSSDERTWSGIRLYFSVFVWSWNRDVLDQRLAHA